MEYMTIKEISSKWGITDSRIRLLCREGRIEGAKKVGRNWVIPSDAPKPIDKREKNKEKYLGLDFDFSTIDTLKIKIDHHRPLSKDTVNSLNEKLLVEWTYHSNAIEGNTLTMSETKVVLEGITIGGKTMREHLEVINHRDAILFVENIVSNKEGLTQWNIKNIHALILKEIDRENAGKYRNVNVLISGANHNPPNHVQVDDLMINLLHEYHTSWSKYHPIIRAALLHGEFVKIHPFVDGNGRTARLLLNFELMRNGYPPIILKKEHRVQYYESLDIAHTTKDYSRFIRLITQQVIESENLWISLLG